MACDRPERRPGAPAARPRAPELVSRFRDGRRSAEVARLPRRLAATSLQRLDHGVGVRPARRSHGCQADPPFTEEHEELRQTMRRFVETELRRTRGVGGAQWFPNEVFPRCARARLPRAEVPRGVRRPGRRLPARRGAGRGARALRLGRRRPRGSARTSASPRRRSWKFGTEDQKQRYLVPGIRGEKIAALGDHRARRGLRRRRHQDARASASTAAGSSTARRCSSRTACARDFVVTAVKTTAEGGHHGISFFIVDTRRAASRASQDREARLARVRHRADQLRRRLRARGEPARRARTRASS